MLENKTQQQLRDEVNSTTMMLRSSTGIIMRLTLFFFALLDDWIALEKLN